MAPIRIASFFIGEQHSALCVSFQQLKKTKFKLNRRDGVGDGQLKLCKEFELPQIKKACRLLDEQYDPTVTFIVVRKRIHTRIFKESNTQRDYYENPPAGTVIDHSITRRGLFDFYLVSQNMRHGTATPSHYVVVENECALSPDILQQLSYKLT